MNVSSATPSRQSAAAITVPTGHRLFCWFILPVLALLSAGVIWAADLAVPVVVEAKPFAGITVCFIAAIGPFSAARRHWAAIAADFQSVGIDSSSLPSFGIYYDNPNEVPQDRLRAIFGKIVQSPIPGLRCNATGAFASVQVDIPYRPLFLIGEKLFAYPALNTYYKDQDLKRSAFAELYLWHPGNVTILGAAEPVSGIMDEWPGLG
jgi:hypothetical protein